MCTRILLVRAVNVGGAKLPMAEFRQMLGELGGENVRTYIASGNAVLDVPGDPDAFDRAVERAIEERYGYFREVISRSPEELQAALEEHPFDVIDPRFSYVVFLTAKPAAADIEAAWEIPSGDDRWEVVGKELHLRFADGLGRATLDLDKLVRRLKVAGTARNLRTVQALVDLAAKAD